ncbi:MAG: hypothetical protein WCD11_02830 [Solirubrobacteraceae bacterium]
MSAGVDAALDAQLAAHPDEYAIVKLVDPVIAAAIPKECAARPRLYRHTPRQS